MEEKIKKDLFTSKRCDRALKIMRTTFLMFILSVFTLMAENMYPQQTEVSLKLRNVTLKKAISEIERNSDYVFLITDEAVSELNNRTTINVTDESIQEILETIFNETALDYNIVERQISVYKDATAKQTTDIVETKAVQQQKKTVRGIVLDEHGEAIIGANIMEKGTTNGVVTDFDGNFSFSVADGAIIVISYIGYETQEIKTAGKSRFDITLYEDTQALEEVVVVAYGEQKRSSFTGSATVVGTEAIAKRPISNVMDALEGMTPGVHVTSSSGQPYSSPSFRIRGTGSINASNSPLIVLDGVPYEGGWNNINPHDVESITVLKDAASTAIYGARGGNGVILVTTKSAKRGEKRMDVSLETKFAISQARTSDLYDVIESPGEYYELHYKAMNNYYQDVAGMGSYQAHKATNEAWTKTPAEGGLGYMVYDVPDGEYLIGSNGRLNPNATLGNVVKGRDGNDYLITPDDWLNETFKLGLRQDYNLRISGATENMSLLTSFGYTNDEGVAEGSFLERFTARMKGVMHSFDKNYFGDFSLAHASSKQNDFKRPFPGNGHSFNDPHLHLQWHYYNDGTGHAEAEAGADANIFPAWEFTTGHPDVIVAIVDGGIDVNHPDLKQNLWINKGEIAGNGIDDDDNGYIDDIYGWKWGRSSIGAVASGDIFPMDHGSHCAGTVTAVNNNVIGVAGVAGGNGSANSGVRLMSCQTYVPDFENYPNDPHGNSRSTSKTPDAFAYAADNGAVIANCSFSYSNPGTLKPSYEAGIKYFIEYAGIDENGVQTGPMKGGLLVGSGGGQGEENRYNYPGSYKDAMSVAYSMSNMKKSPSANYGDMIDVVAPGGKTRASYSNFKGGVLSTIAMESINGDAPEGIGQGYMYKSGSSMAIPHVSGIAALVLSVALENDIPMTWDKLKQIIMDSCWDFDKYNPEYAGKLGAGHVDAEMAIKLLLTGDDYFTEKPENVSLIEEQNSIEVQWTVPGDSFGKPIKEIELFYSLSEVEGIDLDDLPSGVRKEVTTNTKEIGEADSRVISNLSANTQFYFALRSIDNQNRQSDPVYINGKTRSGGDDGGQPNPEKPGELPSGQFKVHPTTVTDYFTVSASDKVTGKVNLSLFSPTGIKVYEREFIASKEGERIGVKSFATGSYTVELKYSGNKETHKIIKY